MTHHLSVQGRRIEAAWWGDRRSPRDPIVLLHEGLGSVAMWKDTPEKISVATGHPVMAYSRFGHGRSDLPATPHTTQFMHDEARVILPLVLDAAAIERAILIGHSDGGSIALLFAATFPGRVRALILEAPHVFVEDISIASIERMKTRWNGTPLRQRLARYHDDVDAAFRGWNDVWLDPAFRVWNLEEFLPRVTCPLLLIQGRDDQYGTLRQIETIAEQVTGPVETLILEECGHSPHLDRPTTVIGAIADFLERLDAGNR